MNLIDNLLAHRIVRFAMTGGLATLTHIAVAFTLLHFFSTRVFYANLAGFACAFGLSYLMQSLFVFRSTLSLKNLVRFFTVQFSALLISQLLSEQLQETNSYLRVLLVVFMIPLVTYLIHRIWTYNQPSTSKE
ncbi:GtrA family protein [Grimontia hollisae]|uniref:GtrA family protein n=2 Tax=Grimontia hollisae TaxID=673 RepID=D0I3Z6_GRIHO|nr:GtrA family protein [Grimontia hollisae]EEY73774.1 GtrA family protein [Grimontia hollisae CIP 101886]MDF2183831.1 GtrA family protein [Grimontia hollisae]STO41959.1 GtrA-like protein [Grimontia hollisae]STO55883.1 GtrA-like protein [Grimontia hollisae]STQ77794.1 GtrA-like protein [Grimontia hollisae]